MKYLFPIALIIFCFLNKDQMYAQDTTYKSITFRNNFVTNRQYEFPIVVNYSINDQYYTKTCIGKSVPNSVFFSVDVPDSIIQNYDHIAYSYGQPIKSTLVENKYIDKVYFDNIFYSSDSKPYDFYFDSSPQGALLFLIPMSVCRTVFKTIDYNKINVTENDLKFIQVHKISTKPTPLNYTVHYESYLAVFVIEDKDTHKIRIAQEFIKPNRDQKELNIVTATFK